MEYKYQYITPGYLGEKVENATLNSKFFSELFNNKADFSKKIIFPQKVPKTNFFEELCELENDKVREIFIHHVNKIVHDASNRNLEHKKNMIRILMRYGCFEQVVSIIEGKFCSEIIPPEFSYLLESAKLDYCFSKDMPLSLEGLKQLSIRLIDDQCDDSWLKWFVLNRFIVSAYKFQLKKYKQDAIKFALILRDEIKNVNRSSTYDFLSSSLIYRGLAMVSEWGHETQNYFINESIALAKTAPLSNLLDSLIVKDNLYPCLQSMAKWNMRNNFFAEAEENLAEMIELDPYDSTGFSEMGIFLMKSHCYEKAATYFKTSASLGPPGVGMNTYLYAKMLQQLGNQIDAVTALYEVTEIDKQAVSPWIDLLHYYERTNEHEKVRDIAKHILEEPELKEQLEEDEFVKVQSWIG